MPEPCFDVVLFDYDGVITDSASIRVNGFLEVLADEPADVREAIRAYTARHGGESRFVKFRHIYEHILQRPLDDGHLDDLCARYERAVLDRAHAAPFIPGARELVTDIHRTTDCYVVSGIPQTELRVLVDRRGLTGMFREVLGSPVHKSALAASIVERYPRRDRIVFIGDTLTDLQAARSAGIAFLGVASAGDAGGLPPDAPKTSNLMSYRPYFAHQKEEI